jgi:hypothetical protein
MTNFVCSLTLPRKARPRRPGMNYTYVKQSPFVTVLFKYRSMGEFVHVLSF